MKIINKFLALKTWQKIGIGIALLSIMKYFFMVNTINVYASGYTNPNVIISNQIDGTDEKSSIKTSAPYMSNWLTQTQLDKISDSGRQAMRGTNNVAFIKDNDNAFVGLGTNNYVITQNSTSAFLNRNGETGYYTGFNFYKNTPQTVIEPLEKGHYYTFLFEFYTNNIEWNSKDYSINDFNISGTYSYYNGSTHTSFDLMNKIDIQEFTIYTPGTTYTNPNYGFILFSFKINELFPEYTPSSSYYYFLEELEFNMKNDTYNTNDIVDMNSFNYIFKSDNGGSYKFSNIYILKDVDTFVGDQSYTETMGGNYLNQTIYKTCEPLDISCHIENIFIGVKSITDNLMYNLMQFTKRILLPDMDRISQEIETTKTTFNNKFPMIQDIQDYFQQMVDRFEALEPQHEIHFNGVKVPGYNTWLIEPFDYDFDDIIESNEIKPYYLLYTKIITIFLVIGLLYLYINLISSIIYNTRIAFDFERG